MWFVVSKEWKPHIDRNTTRETVKMIEGFSDLKNVKMSGNNE
jgi:hypothetical protein